MVLFSKSLRFWDKWFNHVSLQSSPSFLFVVVSPITLKGELKMTFFLTCGCIKMNKLEREKNAFLPYLIKKGFFNYLIK